MKQAELAQKIGVPQSTLSKYENGNLRIDTDTVYKIAVALGVSPNDLMNFSEKYHLPQLDQAIYDFSPQEDINALEILKSLEMLNTKGQKEAAKRVHELTKLDEYTKKEGE